MLLISGKSFSQTGNIAIHIPVNEYAANEVTIAINPVSPNYLSAGANISYFYSSSDSGKTWSKSNLASPFGVWGDPCIIYDALGNLYYAHLSNPPSSMGYWIDRIVVQKSTDNGRTWNSGAGVGYSPPRKMQDKEWLTADFSNSVFRNNLYLSWTEFDHYGSTDPADSTRILFSRSTDHGESWSQPVRISDRGGNCIDSDETVEGCVPAVGPEGQIYLSWAGPLGLMFDKSTDGGRTFGGDIFVSSIPGGWDYAIPGISRANGMPITCCDISNSPYRGNIYISWSDQRNGEDNTDIFFVKSTDGGGSWSSPIKVNDDNTNRHQFFNWMTVDNKTGIIYIIFYDRRNTNSVDTEVYLARSADGGKTFSNFRISNSSFSPNPNIFFGDYTNIAAYNGKVYPIWMSLNNSQMTIFTSGIRDDGKVTGVDAPGENIIRDFRLFQNYPNPFNPSTTISYQVPEASFVSIKIYDMLGSIIAEPVNEYKARGIYEVSFDANSAPDGLPSGIYFYKFEAGSFRQTKKMILLK